MLRYYCVCDCEYLNVGSMIRSGNCGPSLLHAKRGHVPRSRSMAHVADVEFGVELHKEKDSSAPQRVSLYIIIIYTQSGILFESGSIID
jgi:hypothetical protein